MSLSMRLVCDCCAGETLEHQQIKAPALRQKFFGEGWKRLNGGIDLCPLCEGSNEDYWVAEPF